MVTVKLLIGLLFRDFDTYFWPGYYATAPL